LLEIKQWGPLRVGVGTGAFYGCGNLKVTASDVLDTTGLKDMRLFFSSCELLTGNPSINNWDVSKVQLMGSAFAGTARFNMDLNKWDVSSVTDMTSMFNFAQAFNGDISTWNTGKCQSMINMLQNSNFTGDISKWNIAAIQTNSLNGMLTGVTLSLAQYDKIIAKWSQLPSFNSSNLGFSAPSCYYRDNALGNAAHALLVSKIGPISDAGPVTNNQCLVGDPFNDLSLSTACGGCGIVCLSNQHCVVDSGGAYSCSDASSSYSIIHNPNSLMVAMATLLVALTFIGSVI
jgi:hypothetical protein